MESPFQMWERLPVLVHSACTHTHTQKNTATTHTSSSCGLRQAMVPPLPGQGNPADALSSSWHSASRIQRQWLGRTVAMAASDQACRQGQWLGFG